LPDNPVDKIDDDAFGFRPYIEELHGVVAATGSLPLTVGVFGSWGSGKSSFLLMWGDLLSFAPNTRTLWFNPWKYDQKIDVWAALIQSLLAEMRFADRESVRDKAARLARAAAWLALKGGVAMAGSLAGGVGGGLVGAVAMDRVLDQVALADADFYRQLNRFERDFSDAVAEFVGTGGRLVVFVDDLDRCTPESALTVLEALKLFMGDARCVFVIAMDYDLLTAVANMKFGRDLPVAGSSYLEKIVQLPFFLPDIGFDALRFSLARYTGGLAHLDQFWDLVRIGLGANPRRVKRYINVLNLAIAVARREDSDHTRWLDDGYQLQLAKLLILRSEHRNFFNHLLTDPDAWLRLERRSAALPLNGDGHGSGNGHSIANGHSSGNGNGRGNGNASGDGNGNGSVLLDREADPALAGFLQDPRLAALMMARPDCPTAPPGRVVAQMLRTVRISGGSTGAAG
jgi:KAP family P-loop domain